MRRVLKNPGAVAAAGSRLPSELVYGWGNEFWSAKEEYLAACVRSATQSNGPILECGSGLSTLVVGAVAQRLGNTLWSLEHSAEWGKKVTEWLARYQLGAVHLFAAPLRDYGDFSWYDPPMAALPDRFATVLCDGPPSSTPGGRYGLMPVMRERLASRCVILLDDAEREGERVIAKRWAAELGATYEILGETHPYVMMTLGNGSG